MSKHGALVAIWVAVVVGCGGHGAAAGADAAPDGPSCVPTSVAPRVVYLNRQGGSFVGGPDDSSRNSSLLLVTSVTLPPPAVDDAEWDAFVACFGDKFRPFNVTFTETDPGPTPHVELVVIDDPAQIGLSGFYGAVAGGSCDGTVGTVNERAIEFLMWSAAGSTARRCYSAASLLGIVYGLDRVAACADLMSVDGSCPDLDAKTFTNAALPCGESEPGRECVCGGTTQNSFMHLLDTLGPACM